MSTTHITTDEGRFRLLNAESQGSHEEGSVIDAEDMRAEAASILLGESGAARRLRTQVQHIAPHFRTVLIRGESGSGKQLVARALHAQSPGAEGPFMMARASALGEPGASLDLAQGGTLYLTGIGELNSAQQDVLSHFLRACSERRGMGVRVLASSDRDLRMLSATGQFRPSLYALLSAVEIVVPPLRERVEDIPALAAWLLCRLAGGRRQPGILTEGAIAELQQRSWPDNLRDLERVVTQADACAEGGLIEPQHLLARVEPEPRDTAKPAEERMAGLHEVMMRHVLDVLTRCSGNKVRAAQVLGISRSTLYRMLGACTGSPGAS